MSGNRFDFLEIGEGIEAPPPPHSIPTMPDEPPPGPPVIAGPTEWPTPTPASDGLAIPSAYHEIALRSVTEESSVDAILATAYSPGDFGLRVVEVLGGPGTKAGQFNYPTGVAVDANGVLYVADSYNHRIQRITPAADVAPIGSRGIGRGQFQGPVGVAVDANLAFYVVEQSNHRVQKFSAAGRSELIFGKMGTRIGEFRGPSAIAIAPSTGHIYVVDTGNMRVQRFDVDGRYIGCLGMPGTTSQPLTSPTSVVVDARDHVYVSDLKTNRIVRYDPAGRLVGTYYAIRPRDGLMAPRILNEPRSIAMDTTGLLYILDSGAGSGDSGGRLQVVDSATGSDINCLEDVGHRLGRFARPSGVALGPPRPSRTGEPERGDVFVADTANHRVLRFSWR